MNIYDLKFGEHQWFSEMNCNVLRVPGGWLFREHTVDIGIIACSTFVPFNNEFMENSDQKEAETQPITQQGRLEDSAQISALISKLEDVVASNGNVASVVTELKYAAQKLLPC